MKRLCGQVLIVLISLLGGISTVQCQVDSSVYSFNKSDVKQIAYAIESRRILMRDTSEYKKQITSLKLKVRKIEDIISSLNESQGASKNYIDVLEFDIERLKEERDALRDLNRRLEKKNKILRNAVPIGFAIGAVLSLFI